MFGFDPLHIMLTLPGLLLSLWASFKVKSTFNHFSQVRAASGISGAEAAAELMRRKGIHDVKIEMAEGGHLSDHYDPVHKALRLSPDVYNGRTRGRARHPARHGLRPAQVPLGHRGPRAVGQ